MNVKLRVIRILGLPNSKVSQKSKFQRDLRKNGFVTQIIEVTLPQVNFSHELTYAKRYRLIWTHLDRFL